MGNKSRLAIKMAQNRQIVTELERYILWPAIELAQMLKKQAIDGDINIVTRDSRPQSRLMRMFGFYPLQRVTAWELIPNHCYLSTRGIFTLLKPSRQANIFRTQEEMSRRLMRYWGDMTELIDPMLYYDFLNPITSDEILRVHRQLQTIQARFGLSIVPDLPESLYRMLSEQVSVRL